MRDSSKKHVLVADADAAAIEGYRQALGDTWEVTAVSNGTAALAKMEEQPADVVIADLNLPEIDGAELLNRTRRKFPKTVLFIVAAEAERERVMKNVLGAHQYLTKPCDPVALKHSIERALALDTWIASNRMRELVGRVRSFPTVPSLYLEVLAALRSPSTTTADIGAIIAKDMAMMTKLLQVINSAYFGLSRKITDPVEAVGILGFESVKSMVMTIKLLSQYDKLKPVYFSIDKLWRHSTEVARIAKQLVKLETDDSALAESAHTAGLMHDLGKVVLAANFDEQYRGAQSLARKENLTPWEVEKEIFGASHAEIGAYLLGLWGMPLDLLEASALHHQPAVTVVKGFTPLTAVHVANAFVHELHPDPESAGVAKIDEAYLAAAGVLERLPVWRAAIFSGETAKVETKSKSAEAGAAKPAKPAVAVARSGATKPVAAKSKPAQAKPAFSPTQWVYAGAGTAVLLLLFVWSASKLFSGGTDASAKAQTLPATPSPVVVAAAAPQATATSTPAPSQSPRAMATSAPDKGSAATKPDGSPALVVRARTETTPVAVPPTAKPVTQPLAYADLKLQGIFFSSGEPSAIINGQMVHPKDKLAGATVVEIGRSNVVVEYQGQRKVLALK